MFGQINHGADINQTTHASRSVDQKAGGILTGLQEFALQGIVGENPYIINIAEKIGNSMMGESGHHVIVAFGDRFHDITIKMIVERLCTTIPAYPGIVGIFGWGTAATV
jgi:hypothetical protein